MCNVFSLNIVILHSSWAGGGGRPGDDKWHTAQCWWLVAGQRRVVRDIAVTLLCLPSPASTVAPPDTPELRTLRSPLPPRPRPAQADRQLAASSGRAELGRRDYKGEAGASHGLSQPRTGSLGTSTPASDSTQPSPWASKSSALLNILIKKISKQYFELTHVIFIQ